MCVGGRGVRVRERITPGQTVLRRPINDFGRRWSTPSESGAWVRSPWRHFSYRGKLVWSGQDQLYCLLWTLQPVPESRHGWIPQSMWASRRKSTICTELPNIDLNHESRQLNTISSTNIDPRTTFFLSCSGQNTQVIKARRLKWYISFKDEF